MDKNTDQIAATEGKHAIEQGVDVIVSDYKRHLEAAMLAGETCSCCDVKYLTDLLSVILLQRPTPATAIGCETCGKIVDENGNCGCTPATASEPSWDDLELHPSNHPLGKPDSAKRPTATPKRWSE